MEPRLQMGVGRFDLLEFLGPFPAVSTWVASRQPATLSQWQCLRDLLPRAQLQFSPMGASTRLSGALATPCQAGPAAWVSGGPRKYEATG